jgi:tol-pal system protein YbgF
LVLSLAVTSLGFGQKKEYVELNRELLNLEDQVRGLQKSMEEKLAQLQQQGQQASAAAAKTDGSVAAMDTRLRDQSQTLAEPVAAIGAKVDQMASEFQALKESVGSLNVRFGKLEQQLTDIGSALKTLQSPVAPPPMGSAAGQSPESLFQNALGDKEGGKLDLALREFSDYVQNYSDSFLAPSAQYYIGEIHYTRSELDDAVAAFDLVLEKYPESEKTPDAHYMKAMALLKMGATTKARSEFTTLIKRFPNNQLSRKAQTQLKQLVPAAAKTPAPSKTEKK